MIYMSSNIKRPCTYIKMKNARCKEQWDNLGLFVAPISPQLQKKLKKKNSELPALICFERPE